MSILVTRLLAPCLFLLCLCSTNFAQSSTATLSGTILDENGAIIPNAGITVTHDATAQKRTATTNDSGSFTIPLLPPGEYTVLVEREGFTRVQLTNIVLNVGDQKAVQVQLKVGDVASTVEVVADASLVRTDGSVGTVVDRTFVENIPLNGRSFQSLLELTPGVTLVTAGSNSASAGQISVNGQRPSANYVTVDGVSANTNVNSIVGTFGQSGSGQLPGLTAQGTTASLVSVDALQEFRIQTSTYAPEFGRQPGGQISLVTRAGGNDFHGTAFEYFRNEAFEANDWFANRNNIERAPTRQNMFGGTFSGPVYFPKFGKSGRRIYEGKDRTFFFFSYEGLRLSLPKTLETTTPNRCLRGLGSCPIGQNAAAPQFFPILSAFSLPNGPELSPGVARFSASYSDSSLYDATSVRVDHSVGKLTFFGRFAHTPSISTRHIQNGGGPYDQQLNQGNSVLTAGSTFQASNNIVNDIRVNFTQTSSDLGNEQSNVGGAVPLQTLGFLGRTPDTSFYSVSITGVGGFVWGKQSTFKLHQFNVVDNLIAIRGNHQMKFGVDFRRTNTKREDVGASAEALNLVLQQPQNQPLQVLVNTYTIQAGDGQAHAAAFNNLSLYAQDTWKAMARLTLTYGIRWELVPPPHATEGPEGLTLDGLDSPLLANHVSFAPSGTPLWKTRYGNFAPRFGISYMAIDRASRQLVLRGGAGIFHDLGLGNSADTFSSFALVSRYPIIGAGSPCPPPLDLPLPACALVVPTTPNFPLYYVMDRAIKAPVTYQWNFSAEQTLGSDQSLSISYVGAAGRRLLSNSTFGVRINGVAYAGNTTTSLRLQRNLGYSDYQALQLQFRRRLSRGFQALINYTFSQSKDTESADDVGVPIEAIDPDLQYGYSAFDLRHNLTSAVSYQPRGIKSIPILKAITSDWGIDMMFRARSGFPIGVQTSIPFPPLPSNLNVRPNVVQGQPFWIDDPNAPNGRRLNLLAFSIPASGTVGNLPKGVVRGFGTKQVDISLRREFSLTEKLRLQLRAEAFNVFNWPNFADPPGTFTATNFSAPQNFGSSVQMLNKGLGGLSPTYQVGGPRSLQFAARLSF